MRKAALVLLTFFAVVVCFPACAYAYINGDYEYDLAEDGTAVISLYHGSAVSLEIPYELDGHVVTGIAPVVEPDGSACWAVNGSSLRSVTFPKGLLIIGEGAFGLCENLREVTFNDGLHFIGENAFENCRYLKEVNIPDSVAFIGLNAFSNCNNLRSVSVRADLPMFQERIMGSSGISAGKIILSDPDLPNRIWRKDELQAFMDQGDFTFSKQSPLQHVCLLEISSEPRTDWLENNDEDYWLGVYESDVRQAIDKVSNGALTFTSDPNNASVRVCVSMSYTFAGKYSGNGVSISAYNCVVTFDATDMRAPQNIAHLDICSYFGAYYGNTIYTSGKSNVYKFFPTLSELETDEMQAFVEEILAYM